MTTRTKLRREETRRRETLAAVRKAQARRSRRRVFVVSSVVTAALVGLVAALMATSRPTSSSATRVAPDFTLPDTDGRQIHLADYRGKSNVVLYFSEGAGCQSCLVQMALIEKDKAAFDRADVVVLPIVMDSREEIVQAMKATGVTTPFLLDDGRVSTAYGTIGRGMHPGLPGHSFVLVDKTGVQRWYGEYPSMYLSPSDLLAQVRKHLRS